MGTAGRLTAAAGASVSDAPGFLPALEAGRTLTFRHPKHYWPVFIAASVAMTLFGLFLLALGGSTLPILTWEAAVLLVPALAFVALGAFGFHQAVAGGLASLTMDALGLELRYRNARSYRLRWHELAKAERRWTGVRITTTGGRELRGIDTSFDHGDDLANHLSGVAWLNKRHPAARQGLPRTVRNAVKSGALRFRPMTRVPASRRRRRLRLAGWLILSALASLILTQSDDEVPWMDVLFIACIWIGPILEAHGLWKLTAGYDATIELTRRGLVARQPDAAESRLSWEQLAGAELDESRRGREILAAAGRIGVGELEQEFFFWDILGLLREDLRDEIYGFAIGDRASPQGP